MCVGGTHFQIIGPGRLYLSTSGTWNYILDTLVRNKNFLYLCAHKHYDMFSKACEYGIRAVLYIVGKSITGERARIKEIAHKIDAPEAFTAKVLQKLTKRGLLDSITGPHGGFYLEEEDMEKIRLIDVVEAIDGADIFEGCGLGLMHCNANHPCPIHDKFKEIKKELIEMLSKMNVREMAQSVENEDTFLKY